jgi:hypothetical protein
MLAAKILPYASGDEEWELAVPSIRRHYPNELFGISDQCADQN